MTTQGPDATPPQEAAISQGMVQGGLKPQAVDAGHAGQPTSLFAPLRSYSREENDFLAQYEEDWPDIWRGEALKRRAEYFHLVTGIVSGFRRIQGDSAITQTVAYSDEEKAFLTQYELDWPDITKAEALKRRVEQQWLVTRLVGRYRFIQGAPAAEPKPLLTNDERDYLTKYGEEWPDIARGEELRRRDEYLQFIAEINLVFQHLFRPVSEEEFDRKVELEEAAAKARVEAIERSAAEARAAEAQAAARAAAESTMAARAEAEEEAAALERAEVEDRAEAQARAEFEAETRAKAAAAKVPPQPPSFSRSAPPSPATGGGFGLGALLGLAASVGKEWLSNSHAIAQADGVIKNMTGFDPRQLHPSVYRAISEPIAERLKSGERLSDPEVTMLKLCSLYEVAVAAEDETLQETFAKAVAKLRRIADDQIGPAVWLDTRARVPHA